MTRILIITILLTALVTECFADKLSEIKALRVLAARPVHTLVMEAERDSKISALSNPIKDEFETTAQFEQRKKNSSRQAEALRSEYTQKIRAAVDAHSKRIAQINSQIALLLHDTRESTTVDYSLGAYNADLQVFTLVANKANLSILVPLASARGVKENISSYRLTADRQLNSNLEWEYGNWVLSGPSGRFTTMDNSALPAFTAGKEDNIIPPDLSATLQFSEPSGNQMLDAEETATLTLSLSNKGKGSACLVECSIQLSGSSEISYERKIYFGEIKPSQKISKTLDMKAGQGITDGRVTIQISFSEQYGFPPDDLSLSFTAKAAVPPELILADIGINDFSKNGKIEPNEPVEMILRVQNTGKGVARSVVAKLNRGQGVYLNGTDEKDSFTIGDLQPGEYKDATYSDNR